MVTVRPAEPDEAQAILDLHQASIRSFGPETYDTTQVEAWASKEGSSYPIENDDHRFVIAERDGELAGFGDCHMPESEVTAVYVHPNHARAGVGSAILADLERVAREDDIETLGLLATKNAVEFYDQAGYELVETQTHETGGEELECVWMEKSLD